MTWPLSRGATLLFSLVLLLQVASGFVFLHNLNAIRQANVWVMHTHDVLLEFERLQSAITRAETAVRGYIITGNEQLAEAHQRSVDEVAGHFTRLGALVADNPAQVSDLARLEAKAQERLAVLQAAEELRRDKGLAGVLENANGRGLQLMQEIRALVEELTSHERGLLASRERETTASFHAAIAAIVMASAAGVVLIGALLVLIARELKARVHAQAVAQRERQSLQVTLSSIGDAVIVVDVRERVTFVNRAAEQLTQWTLAEAMGLPLHEVFKIINESTRAVEEGPAARALREGVVVGLANHTILITKDGHEISIDDSAAPIRDESGAVSGVVLVFRDITARRRLEVLAKQQHESLVVAERRKDEFLAMLAHELRNPIAPIANALQLMALKSPSPEELSELHDIMDRQIGQMRRLIDDLLDISRISSGKFDLHLETVELASVLRSAIDTSRPLVEAEGHTLTTNIPPQPIFVRGDQVRLAQVIANLLNNAAKYTQRGGQIWLSVDERQDEVLIRVKDTGVGISPEQLRGVFEVFAQIDKSLTRSRGGLGIGLNLAKNIVDMHGGSIEAHSAGLGKGTEFVVRLPKVAPVPGAAPPSDGSAPLGQLPERKILVVDDMRASAMVLSRLLTALGQDVRTAHDGVSALEAVEQENFDLIFSDIAMPGMSGYELAQRLRAHAGARRARLIALTGYGQEEDAQRAARAGFAEHLVKPVGMDDLRSILERSLGASSGH